MKITKLLIANRGEIAVRIIKTANKLGIKTCCIKTSHEPKAHYLSLADEIIDFTDIVSDVPEFLDVDRIIEAAVAHKVDAIHPGYGFLAESPYFAQRCDDEGITFVGPSADAIYKMGNKTIAKQIATKHKVPLLQGSHGNVSNFDEAIQIADKIGYPVILKAASGGGGRGMRIVEKASQMEKMFKLASNEAEKAFNDPSVFIEKYVRNPRHIEFQIFGDKQGNIIHLGERECSIQRKHQKLIEECPSPALSPELREEMGAEAISIADAVGYYSAGTVEFLLDEDKKFYFMEMNTRIQVEHPVTEEVTGLDLIEMQIKVAEGDSLPIKQEDVQLNGWAMELRINAEDVQAGFSPSLGVVHKVIYPTGPGIRVDTGMYDDSVISPNFDSMVAKLIVHADTREEVIKTLKNALNSFWIRGVKTTVPFHKYVLSHKKFMKGDINTSFIEKELDAFYETDQDEIMLAAFLASYDFAKELENESADDVNFEKGKEINPWVLNKRLKSL
ncbi:MAG: acetyl-CoA carboxylase biotin carboxylase subunit [Bacteroidetes bacterium]|jgi:acetyl-CoA carboxylase biotin carboxylase subunit|nr:acetyl-CoA carboxylase biotin carboxylase subunit [Bacteroidota bacterium]